jgi:hypothetical protein
VCFNCLQAYAEAFFARPLSGMRDPNLQMHIVEPPTYSILARTKSTIHITFSYDDDIKLQPQSRV